jgi:NTE family protein
MTVVAQQTRPKVGLVLSGGGAKGLAHIGALRVLEEAGIRPDYITGTSMGSIIGGLYAIGYSAEELDSIVGRVDWAQLLSDGIPLSDVIPEEKHDYGRFHVELNIAKGKLIPPAGFVKGSSISGLLSRLSWRVAGIQNFDNFPIPFKCVAADLVSGEQYVFDKGDFATALRASMAIPSFFSPVSLDSMLLVDGGVLNNFPVKLCKEMGADIIIGVNVDGRISPKSELSTPIGVLVSAAMIGSNSLIREQLPYVDILIKPDLEGYGAGSFFDGETIISRGDSAARYKMEELKALAARLDSFPEQEVKHPSVQPDSIRISQIKVLGLEGISFNFFMSSFGIEPGTKVTGPDLDRGIGRLMGTRYFESVTYRIQPLREGYLLVMKAKESTNARFKFSLHYDNDYRAGFITNVTLRNVVLRGNRLSGTVDVSEKPRLNLSFINYFGEKQRTASRLEVNWENNDFPVYFSDGSVYGNFRHYYFSTSAGFMSSFGNRWEFNSMLQYIRSVNSVVSGFYELSYAGVEGFGDEFLLARVTGKRNTLNRKYFPVKGSEFFFDVNAIVDESVVYHGSLDARDYVDQLISTNDEHVFSFHSFYQPFLRLSHRWVVSPRLESGYATGDLPVTGMTYVGGTPFQRRTNEISFVGLATRELIVQNYAMAQVNFRFSLARQINVTATVNGIYSENPYSVVFYPITLPWAKSVGGCGLLLEYDSFLGPIQLGLSGNSLNSGLRWYLGFGYSF